jgi:hypothetical protein
MSVSYLKSAQKQLTHYRQLGENTFAQLSDDQLFWQPNTESNSIAIIVKHLWGNMLSRWTDFLDTDGEKAWREREAEFDADITDRAEMMTKWAAGWECVFTALEPLSATDMERVVYIRNEGHTVCEAINRQLCHYAYHVGQIVYIGKQLRGADWTSLSIPRGASAQYNAERFDREKRRDNFTGEGPKVATNPRS